MKKLLYIANLRLPTEKAYGIQIVKMCEAFAAQDFEVVLVYPFRKNHIKDGIYYYYSVKQNFKTRKIWAPDFYFRGNLDKVSVVFKDFVSGTILAFHGLFSGVDIIYSRDEWPLYFLSFFKNGLVYEAHRFSKQRGMFYKRFKSKNLKVVVITNRLKEDFIKIGFNPENILVAPDGVGLEEFDVHISKEEAKDRTGLPLDKKIVMYVGHLFEWKGASILLEVARQQRDLLFVFVGGMDYDVDKFKEKARGLENVLILGHKFHKEIPVYLKSADVLVLPNSDKEEISRSYTSPLKLFEYMASGRPIVASALPSIIEILNDNNSILVKPDDRDGLMGGIKKILNDDLLSGNLAQRAIEDVKNYTWEKRVKNIINFIGLPY